MSATAINDTIILAGGLGTRLRSVLPDRQKVVAQIGGKPFLLRPIELAAAAGARRIILALGYRADQVMAELRASGLPDGVEIVPSVEQEPLGTGGAARLALNQARTPAVLVMNGDSFVKADLGPFHAFHSSHRDPVSMLLVSVPSVDRFGAVDVGDEGKILRFHEKGGTGPGLINAGIYLMDRPTLAGIAEHAPYSLERDLFPSLCGHGLRGMAQDVPFIDIGTPETLAEAPRFFDVAGRQQ